MVLAQMRKETSERGWKGKAGVIMLNCIKGSLRLAGEVLVSWLLFSAFLLFWFWQCCWVYIAEGKSPCAGSPWGHAIIWSLITDPEFDTSCVTILSVSAEWEWKLALEYLPWRHNATASIEEQSLVHGVLQSNCHVSMYFWYGIISCFTI